MPKGDGRDVKWRRMPLPLCFDMRSSKASGYQNTNFTGLFKGGQQDSFEDSIERRA
jgi:hypothetical protein